MSNMRRKTELVDDLGEMVHAMKTKDPELSYAIIAERLGYSRNRVMQVYGEWKKTNIVGEVSSSP